MDMLLILLGFVCISIIKQTPLSIMMVSFFSVFLAFDLIFYDEVVEKAPEHLMVMYSALNMTACMSMVFFGAFFMAALFALNVFLCLQIQWEYATEIYLLYGMPYFLLYYSLCALEMLATWSDGNGRRMVKRVTDFCSLVRMRFANSGRVE